jgi:hypothetical protein
VPLNLFFSENSSVIDGSFFSWFLRKEFLFRIFFIHVHIGLHIGFFPSSLKHLLACNPTKWLPTVVILPENISISGILVVCLLRLPCFSDKSKENGKGWRETCPGESICAYSLFDIETQRDKQGISLLNNLLLGKKQKGNEFEINLERIVIQS